MRIEFYGQIRCLIQQKYVDIELTHPTTIKGIMNILINQYPQISTFLSRVLTENLNDSILVICNGKLCELDDYIPPDKTIIVCFYMSDG